VKTLYLYAARDLRLVERAKPTPGPGEALLTVTAVGLCGSDLHWYAAGQIGIWKLGAPIILGHEFAAVVENGPLTGKRVTVDPAIPCEACEFCERGLQYVCPQVRFAGGADFGALSEHVCWPEHYYYPLPDELTDADGAMLEPLGVALHILELCHIQPGVTVGIYGCGPIGLLLVQLARMAGATRIFATDKLGHRLEAARGYGATDLLLADNREHQAILSATRQRGVDVAFEAAGDNAAVATAVQTCQPCGTVVVVGIAREDEIVLPASAARSKELTVRIAHRMNHIYPRAIALAASGKVDLRSLVSHRFPLSEYARAFDVAVNRAGLKVVIDVNA